MAKKLQSKMKISPTISLLILSIIFLTSCRKDEKKEVREKWFQYFFAFVESKHAGIGTDSMLINFQNHSAYQIDSVVMIFHNKGLLVNSKDTLIAKNIPAGKNLRIPVPHHFMGISHSVEFVFIRSKELEFCFDENLRTGERDAYHCQ
jgi:hypothetical protein